MAGPYDLWCGSCPARYVEVADLIKHRREAHPEEIQVEVDPILDHPCTWPGCDRAFRTARQAALHGMTHEPRKCPQRPRTLTIEDTLSLHLRCYELNGFECSHCHQVFNTLMALTAHLEGRPEEDSTGGEAGSSEKGKHSESTAYPFDCCHCARLLLNLLQRVRGTK